MHKPGTGPTPRPGRRGNLHATLRRALLKRIWLPHFIYEALPWIYIGCGLVALSAALYLPGRTWILPWAIVFGLAAVHLGIRIAALRHKFRRQKPSIDRKFRDVNPAP